MDNKRGWGVMNSTCEGVGGLGVVTLPNNTLCFQIFILLDYGGPIIPICCFACAHAPCTHETMHR